MKNTDIYLHGMTLITTSHLLREIFPSPDQYAEISKSYSFPGGETGCCANVLSSLGLSVKIDGNYQGRRTYGPILEFFRDRDVDTSRLFDAPDFDGVEDMVIIDKHTRTIFGKFGAFYEREIKLWSFPLREDIEASSTVGIDPFFAEASVAAAQMAHDLNKPYVTIDCPYDALLHRLSSVNVVSNEFIRGNYPDEDIAGLFAKYTANTDGLVVFTFGSSKIMYGRKNEPVKYFIPYSVNVVSTLGAGDTYKAGVIYALHRHMDDDEIVRFAAAAAGVACENYPIAYYPPTLEKIHELMNRAVN